MSTYSNLKIELIGTGEQSGTWGNTTNVNLGQGAGGLEQAIVGLAELVTGDFTANSYTLGYQDLNTPQDFRALVLNVTATLSGAGTVIVPAIEKPYLVFNNSVGGFDVTVKVSGQTGVTVPNGKKAIVYNDGTDVGHAISWFSALKVDSLDVTALTSPLSVSSGGTGQSSYTDGQLLVGNSTGNTLDKATLTAGDNISITNGSGSITVAVPLAGATTEVLYNDSGTDITSSSNFTYNDTDKKLTVNSIPLWRGSGNDANSIAIGSGLASVTTGTENVAIGSAAALNTINGSGNVAVGRLAGAALVSGTESVGVGYGAAFNNGGSYCTAVGAESLLGTSTQQYNTGLGFSALSGLTSYSNCTGLGANTAVTGSNQVQLGDSATTTYAYGAVQNRSDSRDKADIRDTQLGLNFIMALRPVDFKWDKRDDYRTTKPEIPFNASDEELEAHRVAISAWVEQNKLSNIQHTGEHKRNRYHHGLIAQEVKQVLDQQGIDFGGYQDHLIAGGDDVKSIGYEELIAPLIKAIQELKAEIDVLKGG